MTGRTSKLTSIRLTRSDEQFSTLIDGHASEAADALRSVAEESTVPDFVEHLAAMMDGGADAAGWEALCRAHGRSRAHTAGLKIRDLLREYRQLKQAVLASLDGDPTVDPARRAAVLEAIELGMGVATEEFVNVHLDRESQLHKALSQALQARDDYLSMTTHELRTPISSILLSLQMLERLARRGGSIEAATMTRMLEAPLRQLRRLTGMVNMLLDVARVENQRLELNRGRHDLSEIVRDVATRLAELARESGSDIVFGACEQAVGHWDRSRLEQVVTNLITNAIKYGNRKPLHIEVCVRGAAAVLAVADEGVGIAAEDHERIFERYERVATDRNREGLGLGLYIVREIVAAHGGEVHVDSTLGAGAVFTVALPMQTQKEAA